MHLKNSKRVLSILLTLVLILSLLPATVLAVQGGDVSLTIIHTNDRHGRMGADPYISQLAKNTNGNVLILDAGDALHGQITANLSEGAAMAELMNEVGYSAMVTGNHEFTYGIDRLLELSEMMDFPLLAANIKDASGNTLFESCAVFEMDGVTVGVFGLATPETITASDPRLMTGLTFADPVETAKAEVAELKAGGCDIIIALTHMGLDNSSGKKDRSDNLAESVPGIDVIIDGHSHTSLHDGLTVGNTLIAQTGEYGGNIGVVELTISGDTVSKTAKLIPVDADALTADEAILAKIAELDAATEAVTSVVVGYTPVLLRGEKAESRTGGTNLADLLTDSMLWATGADIAFMTGGNIRASIDAGDITMGEVLTTLPYSNLITTVELTGADMLKILEHGVDTYPEAVGHYIHISGMRFTFDPDAEAGSRVKTVIMSDGNALAPGKTYTVATIDFIAAGGDGYDMMANGKNLKYYGGDAEAFISYLAADPNIDAEAEGRAQASTSLWAKDITGHWAAEYIETCHTYGIMDSDGQGNFNPNAPVTVDEAQKLLAMALPDGKTLPGGNGSLTREKLAAMLTEMLSGYGLAQTGNMPAYTDAELISDDYKNAVVYTYKTGLMRGVGGGRFDPQGIVTRAQMAVVICNVMSAFLTADNPALTANDFVGKRIAVWSGTTFEQIFRDNVGGAEFIQLGSSREAIEAVLGGTADAAIQDEPVARKLLARYSSLTILPSYITLDDYGFVFAMDNDGLREQFNSFLAEVKQSGVYGDMVHRWLDTDSSPTMTEVKSNGKNGTLKFATTCVDEPFSYLQDGKPAGFDVELALRFAAYAGYTLEITVMPFEELIPSVQSGSADFAGDLFTITEARKKLIDFSDPYYSGGATLVVPLGTFLGGPSGNTKAFTSLSDFEGAAIGFMNGTVFAEFIDPVIPNVTYKQYASINDTAAALSSGEIDALAIDLPLARYIVAQNPELTIFPDELAEDSYGFAVTKGSPLAEKGNEALNKIISSSVIGNLENIWFSADESAKTLPKLTYKNDFDGSSGTLRFGYADGNIPMSYVDVNGGPAGFDLDIISRIAYELNMTVEFIPMSFDALFVALNAGKVDIVGGSMSVTAERQKTYDFVGPHYDGGAVLVVRK